MSRARNIKPGFFTNGDLLECQPLARLLFVGLWTEADRRGILEDRPKTLKIKILPGDDCNVDELLSELETHGFIKRYQVGETRCIYIPSFAKHQNPHRDEKESSLPAPYQHGANTVQTPYQHGANTVQTPHEHRTNPAESLLPITDSLNGANAPVENVPKPIAYSADFEVFWKQYPTGHGTKKVAFDVWKKLKPTAETKDEILAGLARWNACGQWQRGFIKHAESFLRNRMWEDEPPADTPNGPPGKVVPMSRNERQMAELMRIAKGESS